MCVSTLEDIRLQTIWSIEKRQETSPCLQMTAAATPPQVVVLDNGCMCCTVRGDLLGAFASVLDKVEEAKAKGGNGDGRSLDSVLVETTGMADPVPIVRTLLQVCFLYVILILIFSYYTKGDN